MTWLALPLAVVWLGIGAEAARVARNHDRRTGPWGAAEYTVTLLGPIGAVSVLLAYLLEQVR